MEQLFERLSWITDGSIQLPDTASSYAGKQIVTRRRTPNDKLVASFEPGSLDDRDLKNNDLQMLYRDQEQDDALDLTLAMSLFTGTYDAKNNRIVNLANGIGPQDAINRRQLTSVSNQVGIRGTTVTTLMSASSLTALPSLASQLSAGKAIALSGYYEADDGGGGLLVYDPVGTDTPDGGSIIEVPPLPGRFTRIRTAPTVTLAQFGLKGDGPGMVDLSLPPEKHTEEFIPGTDDSEKLRKVLEFCAQYPGTTVLDTGRHYMLDSAVPFEFPTKTTLRGVKGATIFDTRRRAAIGTDECLFRQLGTQRDDLALSLTHDTKRPLTYSIRIASATHSGGTVTVETTMPHGRSAGELIYCEGNPAIRDIGYAGYFHVKNREVGPTVPGEILSVPDSTHLTFAATSAVAGGYNTLDASLASSGRITLASDVLRVADTSSLRVGQKFILGSQALHRSGASEQQRIGEQQSVALILSSTMVRIPAAVREDYLASDSAKLVPVDALEGMHTEGIIFVGKGANENPALGARGDRCFEARHVHGGSFKDCQILHFDLIGHFAHATLNYVCDDSHITQDFKDQGGRSSGAIDVSYCWTYGMACQNVHYHRCTATGGRHSWSQNGSSGALWYGVSREIWIDKCVSRATFIAGISTHQAVEDIWVTDSDVDGSGDGINFRFCRGFKVVGNNVKARRQSFQFTNHLGDGYVLNNTFSSGGACVSIGSMQVGWLDPPEDKKRLVQINGNQFVRGTNCVIASTLACASWLGTYIECNDNVSRNITGTLYQMRIGSLTYSSTIVPANNLTRTFVMPFSIDALGNVTVTLDGDPVTGWTATLAPEEGEEEGSGSANRITIPGSYGDLTGKTLVFTRSTRDGWAGEFKRNKHRMGPHEADAMWFELRNPRSVELDANRLLPDEEGATVPYTTGVYVRGIGSDGLHIGRNPGLTEHCTLPLYVFGGTTGGVVSEFHTPDREDYAADASFTWSRIGAFTGSGTNRAFARRIALTGTLTANRTIPLSGAYAKEGQRVRFTRTGGGSYDWGFKDLGSDATILSALAQDKIAEFEFRGGAWTLDGHYSRT